MSTYTYLPCPKCGTTSNDAHFAVTRDPVANVAWFECPHCHAIYTTHTHAALGVLLKVIS